MAVGFDRTLRSLRADRDVAVQVVMWLGVATLLLWCLWLVWSRLPVQAVSQEARLSVRGGSRSVAVEVGGRVVKSDLQVGLRVEAGETLVVLGAEQTETRVREARAGLEGVERAIGELEGELAAETTARADGSRAAEEARAAAAIRRRALDRALAAAERELAAARALARSGVIARNEVARLIDLAAQRRADAEVARREAARLAAEASYRHATHEADIQALRRQLSERRAAREAAAAALDAAGVELARHRIRVPVSGVVIESQPLAAGDLVAPRQVLATILPDGDVGGRAGFAPDEALGRVRAGQPVRFRASGFPPSLHGTLKGRVVSVGQELRDGRIWVEFRLAASPAVSVPREHGLPGLLLVEVERAPVWVVLFRGVARRVGVVPGAPAGA